MDEAPTLTGRHLVRTFGDGDSQTTALNDVTLDLFRGQFALLMGPSGSGKSTLLAVLSGLLHPSEGQVFARENDRTIDIWAMTDKEREHFRLTHCGYIFQGYNLFPALTARQQLEIVLRWGMNVGGREARRQSDEMLAILGLGKKGNLLPTHLSGGEKQRVAIGRGAGEEPAAGICRRTDQRVGLVARRASGRAFAHGRTRAWGDNASGFARRSHRAVRRCRLPSGRWPAVRERGGGGRPPLGGGALSFSDSRLRLSDIAKPQAGVGGLGKPDRQRDWP